MQLTNKTLAYECPSWVTISRNEKRLAALSIIALVKELQYDKVEWTGMMVDLGKRNGIEHFVNLIIWSSSMTKKETE